jgi:hypothetical protein
MPYSLVGARNVLDVHKVEVYYLGWVFPPSPECLESKMDPVGLGSVSDPMQKTADEDR